MFSILGPLEVRADGRSVSLGGPKPRALLAVLLLHPNEPVSAERLALALWGEDAMASAIKTVQVYVSRLRRALGDAEVLSSTSAGYRLRVRSGELDAAGFELRVADGRRALIAGDAESAAACLDEALAMWRGPPLAEFASLPFAAAEIARFEEQRLAAIELRVEADLAAGRHAELVPELRRLDGRASVARAPARAADACPVSRRTSGRRAGGLPAGARGARRRAGHRAGRRPRRAPAGDPGPRSGHRRGAAEPVGRGRSAPGCRCRRIRRSAARQR